MLTDWNDLSVTTQSSEAVAALDHFARHVLSYNSRLADFAQAAVYDSAAPLMQTHQAVLALMEDSPAGYTRARDWIAQAQLGVGSGSVREQLWLAAVAAWSQGDRARAHDLHLDIAERWPRDLLSLKIAEWHAIALGDHARLLRPLEITRAANDGRPWFHGMLAFALSENGRLDEAEIEARRALSISDIDPWGHHALAHIWDARGDAIAAEAHFSAERKVWAENGNAFIHAHMEWHHGLAAIDAGHPSQARAIYDSDLWAKPARLAILQANAAGLLARLDLCGIDLDLRWQTLAEAALDHRYDRIDPFLDCHLIMALVKGGFLQAALDMRDGIDAMADAKGPAQEGWRVAQSLAHGLVAWGQNDSSVLFRAFTPVMARLDRIGGSQAQRDIFWQLWFWSGFKTGHGAALASRISARRQAKPHHPLWRVLAA